jgi:prepilin-type N-terminal cleavage/methylation domain-containing protein
MKSKPFHPSCRGVTLIEMTVVILVLLGLASISFMYAKGTENWKRGKDAAQKLQTVYAAQRAYLADNPTVAVSTLTSALILPYMPTGETTIPTATAENGGTLTIKLDVSPPVVVDGSGSAYDPSGSTSDGLWDVGL